MDLTRPAQSNVKHKDINFLERTMRGGIFSEPHPVPEHPLRQDDLSVNRDNLMPSSSIIGGWDEHKEQWTPIPVREFRSAQFKEDIDQSELNYLLSQEFALAYPRLINIMAIYHNAVYETTKHRSQQHQRYDANLTTAQKKELWGKLGKPRKAEIYKQPVKVELLIEVVCKRDNGGSNPNQHLSKPVRVHIVGNGTNGCVTLQDHMANITYNLLEGWIRPYKPLRTTVNPESPEIDTSERLTEPVSSHEFTSYYICICSLELNMANKVNPIIPKAGVGSVENYAFSHFMDVTIESVFPWVIPKLPLCDGFLPSDVREEETFKPRLPEPYELNTSVGVSFIDLLLRTLSIVNFETKIGIEDGKIKYFRHTASSATEAKGVIANDPSLKNLKEADYDYLDDEPATKRVLETMTKLGYIENNPMSLISILGVLARRDSKMYSEFLMINGGTYPLKNVIKEPLPGLLLFMLDKPVARLPYEQPGNSIEYSVWKEALKTIKKELILISEFSRNCLENHVDGLLPLGQRIAVEDLSWAAHSSVNTISTICQKCTGVFRLVLNASHFISAYNSKERLYMLKRWVTNMIAKPLEIQYSSNPKFIGANMAELLFTSLSHVPPDGVHWSAVEAMYATASADVNGHAVPPALTAPVLRSTEKENKNYAEVWKTWDNPTNKFNQDLVSGGDWHNSEITLKWMRWQQGLDSVVSKRIFDSIEKSGGWNGNVTFQFKWKTFDSIANFMGASEVLPSSMIHRDVTMAINTFICQGEITIDLGLLIINVMEALAIRDAPLSDVIQLIYEALGWFKCICQGHYVSIALEKMITRPMIAGHNGMTIHNPFLAPRATPDNSRFGSLDSYVYHSYEPEPQFMIPEATNQFIDTKQLVSPPIIAAEEIQTLPTTMDDVGVYPYHPGRAISQEITQMLIMAHLLSPFVPAVASQHGGDYAEDDSTPSRRKPPRELLANSPMTTNNNWFTNGSSKKNVVLYLPPNIIINSIVYLANKLLLWVRTREKVLSKFTTTNAEKLQLKAILYHIYQICELLFQAARGSKGVIEALPWLAMFYDIVCFSCPPLAAIAFE